MKLPVYSYTFLSTFDICPSQAFHRYVLKDIPFAGNEATRWGSTVHSAMENRLGKNQPLPVECAAYEFYAAAVEPLKPRVEVKLGVKKTGTPCSFFDDDVWFRGKADVVITQGNTGLLLDWKTNKTKREDSYELDLHAMALQAAEPELERITGHYIWLQHKTVGRAHDVSNVGETLECVQEKADEIEQMNRVGIWPTKQGPLCGFCPVLSCNFNRVGK